MFQQDFILRQIQQLAQVLAQVLVQKRLDEPDEAQEVLAQGLEAATGLTLDALREASREQIAALCGPGEALAGDVVMAVADLLREDASAAGRRRALWLYEAALDVGAAVPFDVHDRMAALRASL